MICRRTLALGLLAAPAVLAREATAQGTRLRWAHVYEVNEPYHTEAQWAAREIAQRTAGRWNIEVFAASALGNEPAINQGLGLGTVDLIYTGVAFAGASFRPLAISHAPYALRDYAHFQAYRGSELHRELVAGYDRQTSNTTVALTYYGDRHVTANRSVMVPGDMRGLKLRIPQAPSFQMFARAVGANATPIAFAEVYLALQNGTVDAQENPLPTIQAKKFHEVQSHLSLTGHITDSLMTIIGAGTWRRLSEPDRAVFREVLAEASERCGRAIRTLEGELAGWFRQQGETVQEPDRAAFRAACVALHNEGVGWTRAQYDRLQAL
jgi:tripartite ATP-independent transporter DctP family solute receptor